VSLGYAKFHLNRWNESPLPGENADFRPLSKFKYRLTPLRGVLPVNDTIDKLTTKHRRYFGHVCRIDPQRFPDISMCESMIIVRGRPKKRWLDFIKDIFNSRGLSLKDAFRTEEDRRKLRSTVRLSRRTSTTLKERRKKTNFDDSWL